MLTARPRLRCSLLALRGVYEPRDGDAEPVSYTHLLGVAIDLQQCTATGTWNFELERLGHARIVPQALETNHNRAGDGIPAKCRNLVAGN